MRANIVAERQYQTDRRVDYSCKYHGIWCPKYRCKLLVKGVDEHLKKMIRQTAVEYQAIVNELAVLPDHVHLWCEVEPQFGIPRLVKYLKGLWSRWLRQEFPWLRSGLPTLWTHSYFIPTAGGAPWSVIKQNIESQKDV